jgi:hypothetical protein
VPYQWTDEQWERGKEEARAIMIDVARTTQVITYGAFVVRLRLLELGHHDPRLNHLLDDISREEASKGRGMLSAVVVLADENGQATLPGQGFFLTAAALGRNVHDQLECWVLEHRRVLADWSVPQTG